MAPGPSRARSCVRLPPLSSSPRRNLTLSPLTDARLRLLEGVDRGLDQQDVVNARRHPHSPLGEPAPSRSGLLVRRRARLTLALAQDFDDLTHDSDVGFKLLTTDDIDEMKPSGIVRAIKERVGDAPVCASSFLSLAASSLSGAS